MKLRSFIHVFLQFASIILLVFPIDIEGSIPVYFVMVPASFLLVAWSAWAMRSSTITVMPAPGYKFKLISKGPYRIIRHPMYTALFLFVIPFLIYQFSIFKLSLFLLFAINQVLKLFFEEKLLQKRDPNYKEYMVKTWRLIPILF